MNVDQFKSVISRRGGLARQNRFAVYITHPGKALKSKPSDSDTPNNNPLELSAAAYEDTLVEQAQKFAGIDTSPGNPSGKFLDNQRDLYLLCESVQIPGRQIATVDHYTSMKALKKPTQYLNDDVTMNFHVTNDYYAWNYFNSWIDAIIIRDEVGTHNHRVRYKKDYVTDTIIQQIGTNNAFPTKTIRLINSYPVTLNSIDLGDGNQNSTVLCSVTFAYDDWKEDVQPHDGHTEPIPELIPDHLISDDDADSVFIDYSGIDAGLHDASPLDPVPSKGKQDVPQFIIDDLSDDLDIGP